MAFSTTPRQDQHTSMLLGRALGLLASPGIRDVKADAPGWEQPDLIGSHRPDIMAVWDGRPYIVEVETCDSLDDEHTAAQWAAFAAYAFVNSGVFEVVVPGSCLLAARVNAALWSIPVGHWSPDYRY